MKTATIFAILGAVQIASADPVSIRYDITYDDPSKSLVNVACSDGPNGMMTKYGFQTFAEIPCHIASWSGVPHWNSETCGQCLKIVYGDTSIYALAVDSKPEGIDLAEVAMNELTHGRAEELGVVYADLTLVDLEKCFDAKLFRMNGPKERR